MDIPAILALYDRELRAGMEHPGARKEVLPHVVRFVRPAPGMNFVLYSRLDETNADAVIAEQVAYFSPMGQPFEWQAYAHDTPPDLLARLRAHGFVPDEAHTVMVLDLREVPGALLAPVDADVRRITARDGLEDVIHIEEEVWGGDFGWMRARMGDHLEIPGYLSLYVAYVQGTPACTGWTYFHAGSRFAGLFGGSTVPALRGRGLYTAVLAQRVQEALERGRDFLVIDASDMSRPIVSRYGFRLLAEAYACEWKGDA